MNNYFYGVDGGFYCTLLHGERTIEGVDPEWRRPTVLEPDPEWSGVGEPPLIEVPDMSAIPPITEQPNPACKLLPDSDLVEITAQEYESLQQLISLGRCIIPDAQGRPSVKEEQVSDEALLGTIAARRYAEETKGITINGALIDTDRDSQALIMGATVSAMLDSEYVCTWKTTTGPVRLTATQLINIAKTVRSHVQFCFDRERALGSAVADGSYTDTMLAEGWPI